MFPYLIPIAVLSQITGTKVVRLRKMYEPILTVYVDDLEKLLKLKFTSDVRNEPEGFDANKRVAQAGGSVAGNARKDLEQRLGRPIITKQNAAQLNHVVTQMIEASIEAANEGKTED